MLPASYFFYHPFRISGTTRMIVDCWLLLILSYCNSIISVPLESSNAVCLCEEGETFIISFTIVFGSSLFSVTDFSSILKNMIDLQSISTFCLFVGKQLGSYKGHSIIHEMRYWGKWETTPRMGQSSSLGATRQSPSFSHHGALVQGLFRRIA